MSAPASSNPTAGPVAAQPPSHDRYHEAVARLDALIDAEGNRPRGDLAAVRARAERRLDRLHRFLRFLGDPHLAAPVVHVAGTSGKGTTAAMIAAILRADGHLVGLHTSPYLQVATEKIQVADNLIAPDAFADLVDETLAAAETWTARAAEPRLTYGEVWFALTARCFAEQRVEIAVIEVGAGGRFDLTNVVEPAVSVVTTVGLDHQSTLGDTISAIAWHKAGIIKPGAPAVTAVTDPVALAVVTAEADRVGAPLRQVAEGRTFEVISSGSRHEGCRWRECQESSVDAPTWQTALPGRVQAMNAAVAVAAVHALRPRGVDVVDHAIADSLKEARLPGRWEWIEALGEPPVLLDGAHNPQKIEALVATYESAIAATEPPPVVLLGLLDGKDAAAIVRLVAPLAGAIVATEPSVLGKHGRHPADILAHARAAGFKGALVAEPEPARALSAARTLAKSRHSLVLATGSLYLIGKLREQWYTTAAILDQRTSWPKVSGPVP